MKIPEWPFEPCALNLEAGRLSLIDEGRGEPVVLVHGTPTWSYDWRKTITALKTTHRVLAFDHLGFGLSDRPATADYRPEAHAARFREAMSQLVPGGKLSLVVHDFGGPIALDWALDQPERLSHLVIVNSWMWPFDDDPLMATRARWVQGRLGRFLYRRLNASLKLVMPSAFQNKKALTKALHQQYLSKFPDADSRERVLFTLAKSLVGSSAFYASLWTRRAALNDVPMTLLWGTGDSAFPPHLLDRWAQTFPHARVEKLDAGHWPHEEVPDAFNARLLEALR